MKKCIDDLFFLPNSNSVHDIFDSILQNALNTVKRKVVVKFIICREAKLLPGGQISARKQSILFRFHQGFPTGSSGNIILKLICAPGVKMFIQVLNECEALLGVLVLYSVPVNLQGPSAAVVFPCTDRDDCNYILRVDSLQYQNRFVIHQPTRCPHTHMRALRTHTFSVEAHNSYVHNSLVISSDGTQLISNSTSLCFQLWI